MIIKYKALLHEQEGYAPFKGAYLVGTKVDPTFKLTDPLCFQKNKPSKALARKIVEEVLARSENEGLIFGGSDWSQQPMELFEIFSLASGYGLKICFRTHHSLSDFEGAIGKACASKIGVEQELKKHMLTKSDHGLYPFIGAMILDYYIHDDYYIITETPTPTIYTIKANKENNDESNAQTPEC